MNTEEINEGGGWKPQSIDSNFELLNRIENLEKKLSSPLYKSAPDMIDFLIKSCIESIDMWKDNAEDEGKAFYFAEWITTNIEKVNIIEQATGKTIEEVLCNHKRS
jgi:hypothetical protein